MLHDNKIITKVRMAGLLLTVSATLMAGCSTSKSDAPKPGTYEGPAVAVGQGQARAFVTRDAYGKPLSFGIRLDEAALSGLPSEPPAGAEGFAYSLELPAEAAGMGYDRIVFDWNPHGHVPPGVYDVPHFDFHFYLIGEDATNKITAVGEDLERAHKAPAPEFMPAGYILPPGTEVPKMGAHAIDPTGDEFTKKSFTKTFIYGFYDGEMIFVEPMITKAYLETKPDVTLPVKVPKAYAKLAYYPTQYGIRYDADSGKYDITLQGLELR